MSARLYLTVYADDDLPTTAGHVASKSLGTVNEASGLSFTKNLNGTDAIKVKINRHHSQASLLVADRYVIVHSDLGPMGGAFLEEAPIDLSAARGPGDEWMEWTGRGPISVLERAVMDNTSDITGGHNPIDGFWDLSNQGPLAGASSAHPIPMMKRALVEAQLDTAAINVVNHSSWTYDSDSASVTPPVDLLGTFGVNVGDDLLKIAADLSQLGGVVWHMSHLFKLDAYLSFGTVRTGAFGASGKVRFQKGVNIADAIRRTVRGSVNRTHLIVGGADRVYITVADPDYSSGDVIRWGFLSMPATADPDALEAAGLAHIEARKRQTDVWTFPQHDHGNSIANGIYEPGPPGTSGAHYWVGDTVTLHSGTGLYDANELAAPISAITWELKTGSEANGDYWVIPQVGATFDWPAAGPGSQHISPAPPSDAGAASCDNIGVAAATTQWANGTLESDSAGWTKPSPFGAGRTNAAARTGAWSYQPGPHAYYTFTGKTWEVGKTYLFTFYVYVTNNLLDRNVRIGYGTKHGTAGLDNVYKQFANGSYPQNTWTQLCVAWTPTMVSATAVGIDFHMTSSYLDDCVVYVGEPGDLPLPPTPGGDVGAPGTYASATHSHPAQTAGSVPYDASLTGSTATTVQGAIDRIYPVRSTSDPTVTDDYWAVGTTWVNTSTNTIFILLDNTTGAAVWQDISDAIPAGTYVTARDGGMEVVSTVAASGSTETLDLGDGNWHDLTLSADCTLTLTGATAGTGCSMLILLRPAGFSVTWPGSVAWSGGEEPDLTGVTLLPISLITDDGGTTWLGGYPGTGGGTVEEADVRDAGRWEVVMDGSGVTLEPVTNEAEDDWLYHWVSG